MRDRYGMMARWLCIGLAAALVLRVATVVLRPDPLAGLRIPALPALASANPATNAPAPAPAAKAPPGTNAPAGTNAVAASTNAAPAGTNGVATRSNPPAARPAPVPPGMDPGMMLKGGPMPMMGRGPGGGPPKPLDPLVQARLDRIIQSEVLGPVPRPMPLALLGIAGTDAFIRTTNGMSGLVHEGAEFGGIRLVRVGVNRVLVDDAGTLKELTIFNGAGGESLLPKPQSPQP